jgi:arabinose-5-phosphate isomerase
MTKKQRQRIKEYSAASKVFENAIEAIQNVDYIINRHFFRAVRYLATHRVFSSGLGKAGLVAHKFASTLASNGLPASFIHASEALHGDFGMMQAGDVLVAFSNSGKTDDVICVADKAKSIGIKLILITGEKDSEIAKRANVVLCYGKIEEACVLKLTPTTSIIVMLVIADALAMAVQARVGLSYDKYAINHHAGYLGQISRMKS